MVAELLTLVYVADVNLYDRALERAYAVVQCYAGMGVRPGVEYHAVIGEAHTLQLINQFSLDVALVVLQFHTGKTLLQLRKVALKTVVAVYARFANAKQIEVRTVHY